MKPKRVREEKKQELVHLEYLEDGNYNDYESAGIPSGLEERMNPDVIASIYETGSYEGFGMMLIHNKDGWYSINLDHCSCYGPGEYWEDDLRSQKPSKNLKEFGYDHIQDKLLMLLQSHGYW